MTDAELHTLSGAYALNALDPQEAERFARHLADCPSCAQEVRELQATAARLARAVAEVPPPGMRDQVMAAIREVRQLPPQTAHVVPLRRPRRRPRRTPSLVAAACLALALAAGGYALEARQQADRQHGVAIQAQQQAARLASLMSAPDAVLRTGSLAGGGSGTVVSSLHLDEAAFVYHGLPQPADDRVYELWYSVNGSMVPAGLLPHGSSSGTTLLTGGPGGAAAVGVTVEPPGGSPKPTGSPVLLLALKA
jgi:anti-sigma-K factor RskA